MKSKKLLLVVSVVMCMTVFGACSGKDNSKPIEQSSESVEAETNAQQKMLTGTIDEIKDFMFIVTDDTGTSYALNFEESPEGLDTVTAGDKVKVTYTGELSEVDAFTGTVVSVEKM